MLYNYMPTTCDIASNPLSPLSHLLSLPSIHTGDTRSVIELSMRYHGLAMHFSATADQHDLSRCGSVWRLRMRQEQSSIPRTSTQRRSWVCRRVKKICGFIICNPCHHSGVDYFRREHLAG